MREDLVLVLGRACAGGGELGAQLLHPWRLVGADACVLGGLLGFGNFGLQRFGVGCGTRS